MSALLAPLLALSLAAGPARVKIAVLDLTPVTQADAARAKLLTQVVVSEVSQLGNFDVVSSAEIQGLLSLERQRQLLGCNEDSSCLAELAGALGVDHLVIGQVGKLGNRFRIDLRLIDVRHSRVAASDGQFISGSEDSLGDAIVAMVHRVFVKAHLAAETAPPAGGLSASVAQPAQTGPSRTPAYVSLGVAAVLAGGALAMTLKSSSTYSDAQRCYADPTVSVQSCKDADGSLGWSAPLADGLWVAAAAAAATSAYFFVRAPPSGETGAGAGVGGSF